MTVQTPIPDFAAAREAMVESQLRPQGVDRSRRPRGDGRDRARKIPAQACARARLRRPRGRHRRGVSCPRPRCSGQLLTQMMPEPGQRALVVGAGTGYSAAVLAAMGLQVVALESSPELAADGRALGIKIVEGPLEAGIAKDAPYDQILIDGAVEYHSRRDRRPAGRWRAARRGADRPRRHAADRRPQGGRRVRLLCPSAMRGFRRFPASAARKHSLSRGPHCFASFISGSLVAALMAGTANADTLRDALVSAYQTNPTLTGQRETLKATDADRRDRQGGRPAAGQRAPSVSIATSRRAGSRSTAARGRQLSAGGRPQLPFIQRRARSRIRSALPRPASRPAARPCARSKATSSPRPCRAYMDVIRDRAIVELNQNNVKVLETNLQATQDRFQIGDLTRTDVAQSEARLQLGRSQLATVAGAADGERSDLPAGYRPCAGRCLRRRRRCRRFRRPPTKRSGSRSPTTPTWSRSAARRSPPAMTSTSPAPAGCRRFRAWLSEDLRQQSRRQ